MYLYLITLIADLITVFIIHARIHNTVTNRHSCDVFS